MSTAVNSVIVPTYATVAKQQPPVVATPAPVVVGTPTQQPSVVVSPSPNAVGSPTASDDQPSIATKTFFNKTTSVMKKSKFPPASSAQKFTNMKISVSNNLLGAKCSKSRKVTSKVILSQKRKAPSLASLKNGRRRVARKTRQEERKKEMLLFDEVIKEEVNLIRGGGGGGKKRAINEEPSSDSSGSAILNTIIPFKTKSAVHKRAVPPTTAHLFDTDDEEESSITATSAA